MPKDNPGCLLVIFGATGDLARRKLYPALYGLCRDGLLPDNFAVVGAARRRKTTAAFRAELFRELAGSARFPVKKGQPWSAFVRRFFYLPLDLRERSSYERLRRLLDELDGRFTAAGNRLFYLAVAPENFAPAAANLASAGLAPNDPPAWQRLVIEKPFGRDLASAGELNRRIRKAFPEEQIYRIDHYLGKAMIQNIAVIRFANAFFEALWNRHYVHNVQITVSETLGVEERAAYYEQAGALNDMFQNHLLQLLTLVAMEPPGSLRPEAVRAEKTKVLRALRPLVPADLRANIVRGQYGPGIINGVRVPGYREEKGISPFSNTETFLAAKIFIDNFRWAGVPFYLRTGKRLAVKGTEIFIQFRPLPEVLYFKEQGALAPNLLVVRADPLEGIYLQLNTKKPGPENLIVPVTMDFCQNCALAAGTPAAYERLLLDVLRGDPTLFTSWEEVALAWEFVEPIAAARNQNNVTFPNYAAGSWGPPRAGELPGRDGLRWWPVCGEQKEDLPACWQSAEGAYAAGAGAGAGAAAFPPPAGREGIIAENIRHFDGHPPGYDGL